MSIWEVHQQPELVAVEPWQAEAALVARPGSRSRSGACRRAAMRLSITWQGERLESRTVMWAAGVMASPAGNWLGAETDRAGRVKVAPDLSLPGQPDVFVIGDTALALDAEGRALPGVAPVAKQQGKYVADLLSARARCKSAPPFRYRDFGAMATIGRKRAVAQIGPLKLRGFPAWALWSVLHIYFLIGFRNRLFVAASWMWNYLTFQRGTRLITGTSGSRMHEMMQREGAVPPSTSVPRAA